jgi:hypothetical protein
MYKLTCNNGSCNWEHAVHNRGLIEMSLRDVMELAQEHYNETEHVVYVIRVEEYTVEVVERPGKRSVKF